MKSILFIVTVSILGLGSCDTPSTSSSQVSSNARQRVMDLGDTIRIRIFESVNITGTDLTLSFVDVPFESRCPQDVVCIWAGQAWADFTLSGPSRETVGLRFIVHGTIYTSQDILFDTLGVRISLRFLDPYPLALGPPRQKSDYNAQLEIRESGGTPPAGRVVPGLRHADERSKQ